MTLTELNNNTADFLRAYDDAPETVQDSLAFVFKLTRRILDEKKVQDAAGVAITITPRVVTESTAEKAARLRDKLARDLWEVNLKAELLDRAIELYKAGVVTAEEIRAAVAKADDERAAYEKTGRGVNAKWKSFAAAVKGWYNRAGWMWSPCLGPSEPKPRPLPPPRILS